MDEAGEYRYEVTRALLPVYWPAVYRGSEPVWCSLGAYVDYGNACRAAEKVIAALRARDELLSQGQHEAAAMVWVPPG